MIVVHTGDESLRLITQPGHAYGAGQLAAQWDRPRALPPAIWPRFLEAVARHDDGWCELEQCPALDEQGRPHTFKTLPTHQHIQVWRHGIETLAQEDPYIGLLLALHARWLYTQVARNEEPEAEAAVEQFRDWLDQRVDALVDRLSAGSEDERRAVEPHNLDLARRLLGFFDMLSLVLLGALPINDWPEPLPFGDREQTLRFSIDQTRRGTLDPWPFVEPRVTARFASYELRQQTFPSGEVLGTFLRRLPGRTIVCRLQKGI
jgi:hypothetical protein